MRFSLEKKIIIFYFLAIAAVLAVLIVFYFNTQKLKTTSYLVEHTQEVIHKSDNVLVNVLNMETGLRGYLLTGEEAFLSPYYNGLATMNGDINDLKNLTKDNTNQYPRMDTLNRASNERTALIQIIIERKQQNKLTEQDIIESLQKGKTINNKIRNVLSIINWEEFRLLNQRKQENENNNRKCELLFLSLLVFILALFVIVTINIRTQKTRNKISEELKQSSQYARSLIEASLDPLVTINADGKITDVNEASIRVTGVLREQLIGTDFSNYFTEPEKAQEGYRQVFEKGFVADYPLTIKHQYGKLTDVLYNASVYKDDTGGVIGVFAAARDITAQKQASRYARSLIEASLDPLVTINADGKITDVNEASIKVTGISREKLLDTDFSNYFTEPEKAQTGYRQVFEKGFVADYPLTIKHQNGTLTDVLYNASVYKDDKGKVLGVFAAARDVTEQKLLSKYSLSLIEASLDPLVTINTAGKITDMNDATVTITGIEREKLIGSDFLDYFTEPQKARDVYRQVFEKGFVIDFPLTLRHKDGKLTAVLFNGSVYKDDRGNVLGVVAVARDITDQKTFENELIEAKSKAELATKKAEESNKLKEAFLANMSHEIRTPMNAIIGFSDILSKRDLEEQEKEYVMIIKTAGENLLTIINDILDISKIEAGMMTFEEHTFSVREIFKSLHVMLMEKAKEKHLELLFSCDEDVPNVLQGDNTRLTQILINLAGNAIKFTQNGNIHVRVKVLRNDIDSNRNGNILLEFSVTDTGIGIPQDKLEHIFERFRQAESHTTRKYGGTGLGLSIAKQLAELQGGTLSVKSKFEEGSVFTFCIPYRKSIEAIQKLEISAKKHDMNGLGKLNILLVEDNLLNVKLILSLFSEYNLKLQVAANGSICIEKIKENNFDIVLMDMEMPVMNGYEAATIIRKELKNNIPIIAMTAHAMSGERERCLHLGMNDYISKPINANLLFEKMYELTIKS